jgi:hypothetical protein
MTTQATHHLKIQIPYYHAVRSGKKNFEVRFNDRGYQSGDEIILYPVDKHGKAAKKEGDPQCGYINYVFSGMGVEKDFVVFGFARTGTLSEWPREIP